MFLKSMLGELIDVLHDERGLSEDDSFSETRKLKRLLSDCKETFHVIELFGMIRSWAYPVVSELKIRGERAFRRCQEVIWTPEAEQATIRADGALKKHVSLSNVRKQAQSIKCAEAPSVVQMGSGERN